MKKGFFRSLFVSAALIVCGTAFADGVWISVSDSVAGQDSVVKMSGFLANEEIHFSLVRPDTTKVDFMTTAGEFGVASAQISGLHLQHAGKYSLRLFRLGREISQDFSVIPGSVSRYQSKVSVITPSLPADGESFSQVKIQARDAYGNPIVGAPAKIFSSREADEIISDALTNAYGDLSARVRSSEAGVSTISVLVNDELLFEKPEIIFFLASSNLKNAGAGAGIGEFLKAQLFTDVPQQTVSFFAITGVDAEVKADQPVTLRVEAKDDKGELVKTATGTIRFSSSDNRAKLPNDYKFTLEDQGVHTFYLSTTFGSPGKQSLTVHDLDDWRIQGEWTPNVTAGTTVVTAPETPEIKILVPADGATFNSSRVTISGTAVSCAVVTLMDGTNLLIDNLAVDTSQNYVYQTPSLADGVHIFQAICTEKKDLLSNKVQITIDRTPPKAIGVELSSGGIGISGVDGCVESGQEFDVKINAAEEISSVSCVLDEILTEFAPIDAKTFSAKMKAPAAKGEYPMSCTIKDALGNALNEPNAAVVKLCQAKPSAPVAEAAVAPTAVSNLTAQSGQVEKVTLFWSPAIDDQGVKSYRVNYALCGNDLTETNMTPDDRTQWYVEPLKPCQKYCFQVTALDANGLAGPASNVAEGTPFCPAPPKIKPPKSGGDNGLMAGILAVLAGIGVVIVIRSRRA